TPRRGCRPRGPPGNGRVRGSGSGHRGWGRSRGRSAGRSCALAHFSARQLVLTGVAPPLLRSGIWRRQRVAPRRRQPARGAHRFPKYSTRALPGPAGRPGRMGRFHSASTPGGRRGAVDHAGSCYTPRGGRGAEARRDLALHRNGADVESTVTSYRVTDVQPLRPTGRETDTLPRRLLGRVLTPQDVVNLGGFFEGKDRASIFHEEQTWLLT